MPHIEVRPAQAEDHDTVLKFCSNTWEWGDYIERVWDDWLHNPDGRLFVATVDDRPVGISHMRMLSSTEAWIEGLRVDPEYRRMGLARALDEAALVEGMRRGATLARLMTESRNARSIEIIERGHMRRVGAFAFYTAPPLTISSEKRPVQEKTQLATLDDLDEIIDYLNVSNVFPAVGGLYYASYTAYSITAELLEARIADQSVYLLRRWDRLDGLAIAELRGGGAGKYLSLGYIDGTAIEAISLIAYDLRRRLSELGVEAVRAYVPDLVLVRDVLSGIEYEWDGSVFYTYEQSLV
ncbi:MAG: GNAT family N-acetyltransferase [Chloroflexi bacterium]|nr:GNAT family N-acetyltransferase [Chloroflexota bacterium]